jgi:hypothetical protein
LRNVARLLPLLLFFFINTATAQSFVSLSDEAAVTSLCNASTKKPRLNDELYFAQTTNATFLPYNQESGILSLDASGLSGLSGALRFTNAPLQLDTKLSPDAAKRFLALFDEGKIETRTAFRIDPIAPCIIEKNEQKTVYKIPAEILLIEFSRKTNGRPLLRFETEVFQQWKLEESLQVVLTAPTVLSGETTLGKISDTLPDSKPLLQRCYAKAILTNRKAQGTLTARVKLNQEGNPEDVEITIDTFGDEQVHRCVVESLRQGKYLAPNTSFSFTVYMLQNP